MNGYQFIMHESVDSTNDEAKRIASQADNKTVILARAQTGGKGRYGRSWVSPVGNLYASFIMKPEIPPERAGQISYIAAIAVAETLRGLFPQLNIALKWPNDILLSTEKLGGILLESSLTSNRLNWVVLGIGINITSAPENMLYSATSLAKHGATIAPETLAEKISVTFEKYYARWLDSGFAETREKWLQYCFHKGETITAKLGAESFDAVFETLDAEGLAQLRLPDGSHKSIASGEIFPTQETLFRAERAG